MRSRIITYFCILWVFSLLAPSIVTLVNEDAMGIVMTITEEETKDTSYELVQNLVNQEGLTSFFQFADLAKETPFYNDLRISQMGWEILLPPPKVKVA
ncbi:hypothetical protein [Zeaxanthinibacter enoshimensis]|uniref:Uncharacterized protein n=1 Tax=Zeaxanthinibacter enoshimensis TaxID=392009 RepID=A0A4R6TVH7_9FLAO|nr:hypothetical protein [Zeaxanthinibacter enoshimensis]TDQ32938.1 hypothetical protein CLV82_0776 [Zeaxanthinibacter enoshimensis]